MKRLILYTCLIFSILSCSKETDYKEGSGNKEVPLTHSSVMVNGVSGGYRYDNLERSPEIQISFSTAIDRSSSTSAIELVSKEEREVAVNVTFGNEDSLIIIKPASSLEWLTSYNLTVNTDLKSKKGAALIAPVSVRLTTQLDSTNKFPVISDDELLTLVQR